MNEQDRTFAKRQIARLIGGATLPIYVLSESDVLVFANDSLGEFLGMPADELLGMVCSISMSTQVEHKPGEKDLSSILALPFNWARTSIKVMPLDNAAIECTTQSKSILPSGQRWARCLLPLDLDGTDCTLVVIGKISNDATDWVDEAASIIQASLIRCRTEFADLSKLWFLQGNSPLIIRALQQSQIASASDGGVVIVGPTGSGKSLLARHLAASRWKQKTHQPSDDSTYHEDWIRIDCGLMDPDLLQGMLDIAMESSMRSSQGAKILLEDFDRLPIECVLMFDRLLARRLTIDFFVTCSKVALDSPWNSLLLKLALHRIELPSLSHRYDDFRILIAAWFSSQSHHSSQSLEYSQEFFDALIAYPWPNDVEELGETLEQALRRNANESILSIEHLPVSIRTCASHFEHSLVDQRIDLDSVLEDVEKRLVLKALERFPNNKAAAAKLLNISRARLLRRLQQWGMGSVSEDEHGMDDPPIFREVDL